MKAEDFLTNDEKEVIKLTHTLESVLMKGRIHGIIVPPETDAFLKNLLKQQHQIEKRAEDRMREEKEEREYNERKITVTCPKCNTEEARKPTGKAKNGKYTCHTYHCDTCGNNWTDATPVSEKEKVKHLEDMMTLIKTTALKNKIKIPPGQLEAIRKSQQDYVDSVVKAEQKRKELQRIRKELAKTYPVYIKELTEWIEKLKATLKQRVNEN